jgi:hypothetical protein
MSLANCLPVRGSAMNQAEQMEIAIRARIGVCTFNASPTKLSIDPTGRIAFYVRLPRWLSRLIIWVRTTGLGVTIS